MASLQDLPDISTISVKDEAYIDPADYIFQHSEYHDVTFNVGSNNDKTETIRAVKVHLIAHSPVFRQLLLNNKANTRVCISDVSPEIFKLILRHVYGGEISSLDPSTAGQLALTADTFNIRPLVKKACMLIVPKSANDVFPALLCVANISCPELEPQVTKIVQEETQALLNSKYFLDLDTKSLEFISRQERLSVTELELWRALVRWAQNKATTNSEKTLRQHLQLILPNVRLLTFSPEDFSKEVIWTKILKSDEVVELLSAIANKHTLDLPGFCSSYKLREQPDHKSIYLSRRDICKMKFDLCTSTIRGPNMALSSVSIYTTEDILIESFGVRSNNISNQIIYELKCTITVYNLDRTLCNELSILEVSAMIAADGNPFNLPLKLKHGQPVILKAKSSYIFELKFNTHHSTYYFCEHGYKVNCKKILFHPIVILVNPQSHILEISFRV